MLHEKALNRLDKKTVLNTIVLLKFENCNWYNGRASMTHHKHHRLIAYMLRHTDAVIPAKGVPNKY